MPASKPFASDPERLFNLHQKIVEASAHLTMVVDDSWTIVFASSAAQWITGYTAEQLLGRNALDFIHPEDFELALAGVASAEVIPEAPDPTGGAYGKPAHIRIIRSDGTPTLVEVGVSNLRDDPQIHGIALRVRRANARGSVDRFFEKLSTGADPVDTLRELTAAVVDDVPFAGSCLLVRAEHVAPPNPTAPVTDHGAAPGARWWRASTGVSSTLAEALERELGASDDLPAWASVEASYATDEIEIEIEDVGEGDGAGEDAPARPSRALLVLARAEGVDALWAQPVLDDRTGAVVGVLTVLRPVPGDALMNHILDLQRYARFAAFGLHRWDQDRRLERAARHDPLTGLANRAVFYEGVAAGIANGAAVLFVDLDGFKPVNDERGHSVGDEVLREVGRRLRNALPQAVLVARIGGDEFGVIVASPALAPEAAAAVVEALEPPLTIGDSVVRVGASVGVAVGRPGDEPDDVIRRADAAMYEAKRSGGGRVGLAPT